MKENASISYAIQKREMFSLPSIFTVMKSKGIRHFVHRTLEVKIFCMLVLAVCIISSFSMKKVH